MTGLLLSDDLIFISRVTGTGAAAGVTIRVAKSPEALLNLARQQPPAGVILDLSNPGLKIAEAVAILKSLQPPPSVVAYGSHVDAATLHSARKAGCDHVMPRSQFVEELPTKLVEWMRPRGDSEG
jgi:DNA-binding NarL/FixJ family response regulator